MVPDQLPFTKSKWTPFAGMCVTGVIKRVVLRGQLAYIDGKVREDGDLNVLVEL